jgi:hypothetical protein
VLERFTVAGAIYSLQLATARYCFTGATGGCAPRRSASQSISLGLDGAPLARRERKTKQEETGDQGMKREGPVTGSIAPVRMHYALYSGRGTGQNRTGQYSSSFGLIRSLAWKFVDKPTPPPSLPAHCPSSLVKQGVQGGTESNILQSLQGLKEILTVHNSSPQHSSGVCR